ATYEIVADTAEIYFEDIEMSILDSTFTGSTFTLNASMLEDNDFAGKTFHVAARKVCSVEDMSEWTSEMTFTTPATAGQALPYADDFEGYISGEATNLGYAILDSIGNYSEIAKTATIFPAVAKRSGYTLNHTIGGEFGLTTAQSSGTTAMAYIMSGEFSWYKYFALEAGKTYEYSLYANVYNSREYDLDVVYGQVAKFQSMTVAKSDYITSSNFQKVTAIFTVPEDGDYFVGVHTQSQSGATYMPIIDDVYFAEVIVDTVINDTICGGEGYAKNGFNIAASEISEGNNTFEKRAAGVSGAPDSLTILNLYAYPVIAPTTETLVFCDNELPQEWAAFTVGQYDTTMTYKSSFGCDSVVNYSITINPSYLIEEDDITIKSGASCVWHGQTITAAGTYTDIQKTAEGCDSIYTVKVTVESGIENISEINMNIIPNPTKAGAMAMVYGEFGDVVRVEILNNLGQIVDAFVPETSPIEVRGIETEGIYFVRVVTTDNSYVQKLIVK
ncbi:MAG: T9SS type A sorting domain-containing protein, partial [Paludibacteraceae bacterium]|nr:T9SS type A sorting domain-containing protein [Paludibacteraceae bacterium]